MSSDGEYRYTRASYPHNAQVTGIHSTRNTMTVTSGLQREVHADGQDPFEGSAGYLKRDYPLSNLGDFSGSVWHTAVTWAPGAKTRSCSAARAATDGVLDSQSDYSCRTPSALRRPGHPPELSFARQYSHDRDRYIGTNPGVALVPDARRETVSSGKFIATWEPTELIRGLPRRTCLSVADRQ